MKLSKLIKKILLTVFIIVILICGLVIAIEMIKPTDGEILKSGGKITENFEDLKSWEMFDYEKDVLRKRRIINRDSR